MGNTLLDDLNSRDEETIYEGIYYNCNGSIMRSQRRGGLSSIQHQESALSINYLSAMLKKKAQWKCITMITMNNSENNNHKNRLQAIVKEEKWAKIQIIIKGIEEMIDSLDGTRVLKNKIYGYEAV